MSRDILDVLLLIPLIVKSRIVRRICHLLLIALMVFFFVVTVHAVFMVYLNRPLGDFNDLSLQMADGAALSSLVLYVPGAFLVLAVIFFFTGHRSKHARGFCIALPTVMLLIILAAGIQGTIAVFLYQTVVSDRANKSLEPFLFDFHKSLNAIRFGTLGVAAVCAILQAREISAAEYNKPQQTGELLAVYHSNGTMSIPRRFSRSQRRSQDSVLPTSSTQVHLTQPRAAYMQNTPVRSTESVQRAPEYGRYEKGETFDSIKL